MRAFFSFSFWWKLKRRNFFPAAAAVLNPLLKKRPTDTVITAPEFPDIFHAQSRQRSNGLGLECRTEVNDLLGVQFHITQQLHMRIDRGDTASAPGFTVSVPDTSDGHEVCGPQNHS